jgi:iron complex transport system ATP-binding protein
VVSQPASEPLALEADNVRLVYPNGVCALDGATLRVAHGEFVSIIGPNGSGKSSLLRALAGLQPVSSGKVFLEGTPVMALESRERARRVALVPQSLNVLPGYSVEDFVLMGRYAHLTGWRLFSQHDREVARENLRRVDAHLFLGRGMDQMSGGERQRALIARALTQESRTVLLDEPTSALDLKHQLIVYNLIHQMHRDSGRTIVAVTHDLNLASQFAQRLILMKNGRIHTDGPPEQVLRREILEDVYEATLACGVFDETIAGRNRPWVLPWAKA